MYHERRGNFVRDRGEEGLAGIRVFLDRNGNGRFDKGEASTRTDGSGRYTFAHLAAGRYFVRVVLGKGFRQAKPARGGPHIVDLKAGRHDRDEDFGIIPPGVAGG